MKVFIFIFIIIANSVVSLQAQNYYVPPRRSSIQVQVALQRRRSILGHFSGLSIEFDLDQRWDLYIIKLKNIKKVNDLSSSHEYQGAGVSYAVNPKSKLQFKMGAEIGFYNKSYLAIHPMLGIEYNAIPNYPISFNVGKSDGFPLFNLKLGMVIFNKSAKK